ncbi:MAG: Amino acid adenylation domain protein, partial [Proteobacteria bacterium]|nr:Amino acid adenylation domain protein [Pseudomonadota bacterium]
MHKGKGLFPLSSVQREIWFEQTLYPETPLYNIACYNRICGKIDVEIFRQAVILLVQENEALRLRLTERDGVPLQSFPEMPLVDIPLIDCSKEADPLQAALAGMQETIRRPFRLFDEPLFRYTLYKLAEDCHLWSQTCHHLIVDGWAGGVIMKQVAAFYNALMRGDPLPVRPGVPYLDFVAA